MKKFLILAVVSIFMPSIASASITASSTLYTTAGTFNYTVSTNACTQIIDAWGGGGAGFTGNNTGGGAGGGGGAFASSTFTFAVSSSHTLVVGAGSGGFTVNGTDTTVDSTLLVADAGLAATDNTTGIGTGGTVANSTGTIRYAGGNGGAGRNGTGGGATDEGGGGGGAAGPHGDGLTGTDGTSGAGGDGGNGDASQGGAGATTNGGTGGSNTNGGGGGGGGINAGTGGGGGSPGAGGGGGEGGRGEGAAGQIRITEFVDSEGCNTAPTVSTTAGVTGITSATLLGNVSNTGGENVTPRGFAWGTSPTLQDNGVFATTSETTGGPFGTGAFGQFVGGLITGTTYYYRAYATNSEGTGFGSIESFVAGASNTPSRKLRLFDGFKINVTEGGRIIILQQ
jgi:hypothetical protein